METKESVEVHLRCIYRRLLVRRREMQPIRWRTRTYGEEWTPRQFTSSQHEASHLVTNGGSQGKRPCQADKLDLKTGDEVNKFRDLICVDYNEEDG